MEPLIKQSPNKLSADPSKQSIAKVHVFSKKAYIFHKKTRLTQFFEKNANQKKVLEFVINTTICARHLISVTLL